MVGRSGSALLRVSAAQAISLTLPVRALAMPVGAPSKNSCTRPVRWSFIASPLPLYGTCSISMPARRLKYSALRCEVVPAPNEA